MPMLPRLNLRSLEVQAQHLIARQRIVDAAVVEVVVGRALDRDAAGDLAERCRGNQHRRRVAVLAVEVDVEGCAFADERAVEADAVLPALRRRGLSGEGIFAVEDAVVVARSQVAANGADARLRQDLDADLAGEVHFRRELIARHADRLDQRLRRQVAALETVDQDLGVGPGDVEQLAPELVGIVRQRVDLLACHDRAERHVALGRRNLAIAFDRHRGHHPVERQDEHLLVLAAAKADFRQRSRLEARELRRDRVAARREVLEPDLPLRARRSRRDHRGLVRRFDAGESHSRARQDAARFVDDSDLQRGVADGLLREKRGRTEAGQTEDQGGKQLLLHDRCLFSRKSRGGFVFSSSPRWLVSPQLPYFTGSNFFWSILMFTRKRSNVVSSVVSVPMARRSRNGSLSPSTSR